MRRRLLLAVACVLLVAGLMVAIIWPLSFEERLVKDAYSASLGFTHFLYEEDEGPDPSASARGEESMSDIVIDGQPGKLGRGWYANGRLWYEHTWLHGKKHGKHVEWDERGQ